jgi:hypothetical protein
MVSRDVLRAKFRKMASAVLAEERIEKLIAAVDRFIIDQRADGRLVTAIDYLIYSMATAELQTLSEESYELINTFKAITSSNVRTLLA